MNPGGIRADLVYTPDQRRRAARPGHLRRGVHRPAVRQQPGDDDADGRADRARCWSSSSRAATPATGRDPAGLQRASPTRGARPAPRASKVDPTTIKINGVTVDPAALYRVTVNSFLADGGDSFPSSSWAPTASAAPSTRTPSRRTSWPIPRWPRGRRTGSPWCRRQRPRYRNEWGRAAPRPHSIPHRPHRGSLLAASVPVVVITALRLGHSQRCAGSRTRGPRQRVVTLPARTGPGSPGPATGVVQEYDATVIPDTGRAITLPPLVSWSSL